MTARSSNGHSHALTTSRKLGHGAVPHAAPDHICKYRWLHAPATTLEKGQSSLTGPFHFAAIIREALYAARRACASIPRN